MVAAASYGLARTRAVAWPTGRPGEARPANLVGALAPATALKAIAEVDGAAHEAALRERLLDGLAALPVVRAVRIWDDAVDAIGTVAFTVEGHVDRLPTALEQLVADGPRMSYINGADGSGCADDRRDVTGWFGRQRAPGA